MATSRKTVQQKIEAKRARITAAGTRKELVAQPRSWRELCHPDLRSLSEDEFVKRSSLWPRLLYFIPQDQWINWYGGMRRTFPGGDGGNGMYMTEAQAAAWTDRTDMGSITIGPG